MRPIHFAADRGHVVVVQLLAESGAEIDCPDDSGMTPLMYAASCDHLVREAIQLSSQIFLLAIQIVMSFFS